MRNLTLTALCVIICSMAPAFVEASKPPTGMMEVSVEAGTEESVLAELVGLKGVRRAWRYDLAYGYADSMLGIEYRVDSTPAEIGLFDQILGITGVVAASLGAQHKRDLEGGIALSEDFVYAKQGMRDQAIADLEASPSTRAVFFNPADPDDLLLARWSAAGAPGIWRTAWGSAGGLDSVLEVVPSRTVKYGQCFVFSGIFYSAMRGLGMASRSVTNFDNSKDVDGVTQVLASTDKRARSIAKKSLGIRIETTTSEELESALDEIRAIKGIKDVVCGHTGVPVGPGRGKRKPFATIGIRALDGDLANLDLDAVRAVKGVRRLYTSRSTGTGEAQALAFITGSKVKSATAAILLVDGVAGLMPTVSEGHPDTFP